VSAITIDHHHLRDALAEGLQRLSGRAWTRTYLLVMPSVD